MASLSRSEILALAAMAFAVLVDGLDMSIVNIVLPNIATNFHTDTGVVSWVIITYVMMMTGLLLPFGKVCDAGNIKKVYIVGFAIFILGSMLCGFSNSVVMLIASRAVQGLGAAMIGSTATMICVKFLPRNKLSFALASLVMCCSIGYAIGPTVGGIISDLLSWHWAFFINVPIGIVAIALAMKALPLEKKTGQMRIDYIGTASLFIAVVCCIYTLEMFARPGMAMPSAIALVAMIVSLIIFVRTEKRIAEPMLNVRLFRNMKMTFTFISYMLLNLYYMGIFYLIPFYMQMEVGLSASFSGLLLLLPSVITIVSSIPIGRYCDAHGMRGFAIFAGLMSVMLSMMLLVIKPEMGWLPFIPMGIVMGLIWGSCGASTSSRIVANMKFEDRGTGSALTNLSAYGGAAIGTALFASLMTIGSGSAGVPIESLPLSQFMDGFTFSMLCALILAALSLFTTWIVKKDGIED